MRPSARIVRVGFISALVLHFVATGMLEFDLVSSEIAFLTAFLAFVAVGCLGTIACWQSTLWSGFALAVGCIGLAQPVLFGRFVEEFSPWLSFTYSCQYVALLLLILGGIGGLRNVRKGRTFPRACVQLGGAVGIAIVLMFLVPFIILVLSSDIGRR